MNRFLEHAVNGCNVQMCRSKLNASSARTHTLARGRGDEGTGERMNVGSKRYKQLLTKKGDNLPHVNTSNTHVSFFSVSLSPILSHLRAQKAPVVDRHRWHCCRRSRLIRTLALRYYLWPTRASDSDDAKKKAQNASQQNVFSGAARTRALT